jgi:Zn-finger nucleic acid-binding protein
MKCPADGATLLMSERHNVEIDYCPECRGIWLDRGELDKILEQVGPQAPAASAPGRERREDSGTYRDARDTRSKDAQYRKKSSPFEFLGDIFGG